MLPQTKYKPVVLTSFSGITGNSSFSHDSSEEEILSAERAESESSNDCCSISSCSRDVEGNAKAFWSSTECRGCLTAGVTGVAGAANI